MTQDDVEALWRMIEHENVDYMQGFSPFGCAEELKDSLAKAKLDVFRCLTWCDRLSGFYMLRGFDSGYVRPSFGIYVNSNAAGQGLANYALKESMALCRTRKVGTIFLKVSSDNTRARKLYERAGFHPIGSCPDTGHVMMEWESTR